MLSNNGRQRFSHRIESSNFESQSNAPVQRWLQMSRVNGEIIVRIPPPGAGVFLSTVFVDEIEEVTWIWVLQYHHGGQ